MPCYDSRNDGPAQVYVDRIVPDPKLEAVLCGVLRSIPDALNGVDWTKAGVTREWANLWWEKHQENDRAREAREKEQLERESIAAQERLAATRVLELAELDRLKAKYPGEGESE